MSQWLERLRQYQDQETPCVLVTLAAIQGSSPREAGAKMIVTADDEWGTLGGGTVELRAQARARALLQAGHESGPVMEEFVLNDALDQACGGRMTLLFEPVWPVAFQVVIFGAGHVGQALVRTLADLPCRVHWIDSRADMFPSSTPSNVRTVVSERPWEEVAGLPRDAYVLIMTHSHETDLEIADAALRASGLAFVGTIGSQTKRARFRSRLGERGFTPEQVDRLAVPIGLPGVGGKSPPEIAIAVAAQLLQLRDTD